MDANDLDAILIGEPVEAMEAAKRIMQQNSVRPITCLTLATNKTLPLWTRTAAIWLLGFIDGYGVSVRDLERICQDQFEVEQVQEHATEAIMHIKSLLAKCGGCHVTISDHVPPDGMN